MGDLESGGGAWDGAAAEAGGTGASRSISGGSLPPRKRLLAGLKQNGGYLGSSSPSASAVTSPASVLHSSGTSGAAGAQGLEVAGLDSTLDGAGTVVVKQEDGCMSCGGQDGGAGWRRIKRSGVFHRLCNPCAQLFSKNLCCPYCLVGYHELSQIGDPAVWLLCCKCRRSVHVDCELKQAARTKADPASYACPECTQPRRLREPANGFKSRGFSGRVGTNSAPEPGQCISSAAAECSSPSHKKPRMSRARLIDPAAAHPQADRATMDGGAGPASATKAGLSATPRKHHLSPISAEEAAAAAKVAAAAATKAAAAAKATAAAKASVAVKAAAAAKAALEAAALAARAEAQARAELRRNSSRSDVRASMTSKLTRESSGNSEKERVERSEGRGDKLEAKDEKTEDGKVPQSSIDDGELARQLHREINSSPRISRSLTPLRRKASGRLLGTPGGSPGIDGATRVWPRSGTPTEPRSQQQTRPRSFTCKDGKRLDARIARHEYKRPEGEVTESGAPTSDFEEGAFDSLQHMDDDMQSMVVKAEPIDVDQCFALDTAGDPALSKPEPEVYYTATDAAVGLIHDSKVHNEACIPALIQGGSSATGPAEPVITGDGAAGTSDIVMDGDFRVDASRWEQQNEALSLMATLIAEDEDYRGRDQEMDDHLTAEEMAEVNASATAEAQHMEVLDAVNSDMQLGDGVEAENSGGALEAGIGPSDAIVQSDTFHSLSPHTSGQETEQVSGALEETAGSPRPTLQQDTVETLADAERDTLADGTNNDDPEPSERNGSAENGGRTSPLAVAGNGESWHPTKLKGLASGGQAFAGGVSISSFGPTANLPVRTPAFASGATGRHV